MDINGLYTFLILQTFYSSAEPKGTVRFGAARVLIAQQENEDPSELYSGGEWASVERSISHEDSFNLRFYIPSSTHPEPSEDFEKFAAGAGRAYLVNSVSANALYFAPEGYVYDEEWVAGSQVCQADVRAYQLRSDRWQFADPHQILTVYFLCGHYCCHAQCCELNYSLLLILILLILTTTASILWVIWLRYKGCCVPRPFEIAVARLLGKKVRRHYQIRVNKELDVIATKELMAEPKVMSHNSRKIPLF